MLANVTFLTLVVIAYLLSYRNVVGEVKLAYWLVNSLSALTAVIDGCANWPIATSCVPFQSQLVRICPFGRFARFTNRQR